MSMNFNSPVMMLPQEVKTPLVPDCEMSSTTGSAEYKRKPGSDALAAPYAKKRVTSTGHPISPILEDKTPLEVSSEFSKNGKDVLQELDCPEPDEESGMTEEEEYEAYCRGFSLGFCDNDKDVLQGLGPLESHPDYGVRGGEVELLPRYLTTGDDVEAVLRFTTDPGDVEPLRAAFADTGKYVVGSDKYEDQYERAALLQRGFATFVSGYSVKLRVHIAFHHFGGMFPAIECIPKI